ncbi:MAG: ABC transporter permease subunit [Clostridiales bacterium]|nr:ABC transporter permease subunit [Clostridiales bacterium]
MYRKYEYQYYLMLVPVLAFLLVFHIAPLFGIVIAFERFLPAKGIIQSEWVGLKYFRNLVSLPESWRIFRNTVIIAIEKIILGIVVPVFFSILLNELRSVHIKRTVQTIIYIPHFLSWVVLAAPIMNIFAYNGMLNNLTVWLGGERTLFLSSNRYFRGILIFTNEWKEFGFGTIVYLAAITGINPNLYEAAEIDGASRLQKIIYVTLPCMRAIIVLMLTRSLGNVLNAGFDQVFNLYSPAVYETADIIDTYVYRVGLLDLNYSLSTAMSLIKSFIGMTMILTSNYLSLKLADYRVF